MHRSLLSWTPALLLPLLFPMPLTAPPQNRSRIDPFPPAAIRSHLRIVRDAHRVAFHRAWEGADEAARARARDKLESMRIPGAPRTAPASFQALDEACLLLRGVEPGDSIEWRLGRLAAALDLRPVPGAFPATEEERGLPMIVQVATLYAVENSPDVDLLLWWVSPEDERVRARREPIAGGAFSTQGFDVHVRSPVSQEARWHLVAEVQAEGASAETIPVPVDCVDWWSERLEGLVQSVEQERIRDPALGAWVVERLIDTDRFGLRSGYSPAALLKIAEELGGAPLDTSDVNPNIAGSAFIGYLGVPEWAWTWRAGERAERVLALLMPGEESPAAILDGPLGEGWRRLARERGYDLLAAHVPFPFGGRNPSLATYLAELPGRAGRPMLLVARGDAVQRLQLGLARESAVEGLLGVVMCTVESRPADAWQLGDVPLLFVAPRPAGETLDGESLPYDLTWIDGEPLPLLDEALLPGRVAAWLNEVAAPDEENAGARGTDR